MWYFLRKNPLIRRNVHSRSHSRKEDMDVLPQDILCNILARITRWDATKLAVVSKTLHLLVKPQVDAGRCRPRLLVASSRNCKIIELDVKSGAVVRSVYAYKTRKRGANRLTAPPSYGPRWITSMAFGPDGDLYVCQYKVAGVEQYNGRTLAYRRVFVSSKQLLGPEGLAFSKNHLYVASAVHGHIARVSLEGPRTGQILEIFSCGEASVPWGMCCGPDGNLYVALDFEYVSESYGDIPPQVSGFVRQIVLGDDGSFSFVGKEEYINMQTPHGVCPVVNGLARPSGLCFDDSGHLYVTDIRGYVRKCQGAQSDSPGNVCWDFTLVHERADQEIKPWDVCVIQGKLYVTSHTAKKDHDSKIIEYELSSGHFRRVFDAPELHECNMFAVEY